MKVTRGTGGTGDGESWETVVQTKRERGESRLSTLTSVRVA